jgi:hypothetical protein
MAYSSMGGGGNSAENVAPWPGALSTQSRPPCRSTIALAMFSPRPDPAVAAVEAVEELLSCILRNTWSVVRDLELHAIGRVPSADGDAGARRGVIVRVGHEVDQRLLQPALISYHQERAVHRHFEDLPFLLGQRMGHRNRTHDCGTEIKR